MADTADKTFDVLVIGGGPGGYVCAIRAAQLGLKAVVIEKDVLGGVCLNWGCIPTKALLHAAELKSMMASAAKFGVEAGDINVDLRKVVKKSRDVAKRLSKGVEFLLEKNKVEIISGTAVISGPNSIEVNGQTITAKNVVVATGARGATLDDLDQTDGGLWGYREAMIPAELPESLVIIGSGAIGIEFASFYVQLGTDVTLIEVLDRILPTEDLEIASLAEKAFLRQGMSIHKSAAVSKITKTDNGKFATAFQIKDGKTSVTEADRVILAVGIAGNIEGIGLEAAGVENDGSHIKVNEWNQTSVSGIYAIGDVAGGPWLAHKASHEGVRCAEHIAGLEGLRPVDRSNVPACVYSSPQIASVGLSEEAARDAGHKIRIGRFPFRGNGKAMALGEDEGLVKTIFDAHTGALLGAHMIGAGVTELIGGLGLARGLETTEAELIEAIFPHPTLSEMIPESVLDAFGRALHV